MMAALITSAGRFSPLGPRGIALVESFLAPSAQHPQLVARVRQPVDWIIFKLRHHTARVGHFYGITSVAFAQVNFRGAGFNTTAILRRNQIHFEVQRAACAAPCIPDTALMRNDPEQARKRTMHLLA